MAAEERHVLALEVLDPRVVGPVAARRALELGLDHLKLRRPGRAQRALEGLRAALVVDRGSEALELVARRVVQSGADQQAVERQLDVVAAGRAVSDRDAELLLDRRAVAEAGVVVEAKEARLAEVREARRQCPARPGSTSCAS